MLLFPHKAFKISYFASLSKTALTVAYIPDDIQLSKYSPNSRCRPSSCLFAVLAMFLAIILPSSYS